MSGYESIRDWLIENNPMDNYDTFTDWWLESDRLFLENGRNTLNQILSKTEYKKFVDTWNLSLTLDSDREAISPKEARKLFNP